MSAKDLKVVKELDSRYAIVLGFCADENLSSVFDSEAEARAKNEGNPPRAVFVIFDHRFGTWANFAEKGFSSFEAAMIQYHQFMESQPFIPMELLLCMPLDENLAISLYQQNIDSKDSSDAFAFCFYDIKNKKVLDSSLLFDTCANALAYYSQCLKNDEEEDEEEQPITDFSGKYAFLDNGFDQEDNPIHVFGLNFRTAEGAFQSQKCPKQAACFVGYSGREAKRLGAKASIRKDWNFVQDIVMYEVLQAKFTQDCDLEQKLLDTGSARIEPHNMQHDNYWGGCQCAECVGKEKENRLGAILMRIRENLRQ